MKKILLTILILAHASTSFAGVLTAGAKSKIVNYTEEILAVYPNTKTVCVGEIIVFPTISICMEDDIDIGFIKKYTDSEWALKVANAYTVDGLTKLISVGRDKRILENAEKQPIVLE